MVLEHASMTDFCGIPLVSLRENSITELNLQDKGVGVPGAIVLSKLLPSAAALTSLKCAAPTARFLAVSTATDTSSLLPCSRACILYCFLGSLRRNDIGADGAKAIGKALTANHSLTSLEYAPHHKPAPFGKCQ